MTSGLDSSGVQQEHNLNAFLTEVNDLAMLNTVFEETLLFDLRACWSKNLAEPAQRSGSWPDYGRRDGRPTGRYVWALVIQMLTSTGDESGAVGDVDARSDDSRD